MLHHGRILFIGLLTTGLAASGTGASRAAEETWDKLPNGVLGRVADFEGAGGVKIAGYVRKPEGAGPFPLVILLHGGGPTAKPVRAETDEQRAKLVAEEVERASKQLGRASNPPIPEFLAQGWAVYSIDFRPNPLYMLDPLEWDDTLVAIKKALSWTFVDPNRVALLGGSHGGHVMGRMASRVKVCCTVLYAPAGLDLIELAKLNDKGTPVGGNQRLIRELEQRAGVKMAQVEKDPDAYKYSSPLTEVAKVQCPILLVSGRNDNNAPLPVMDAYVDKLHAAKIDAETYHPDNGPHGFYFGLPQRIPETDEATRRTVAFIKKQFEQAGRP